MSEIKQVIVVRTTYPHPTKEGEFFKPRSGKLIAQACHAAMAFLTRQLQGQQIQFRHERATGDLQARFAADIDIDARLVPYWEVSTPILPKSVSRLIASKSY
jgi:peptidyl-tRNA hydrolase